MAKVKNIGTMGWRGWDFDGRELHVMPGQEIEMSDARAAQLMADFKTFELAGEDPGERPGDASSVVPAQDPPQEPTDGFEDLSLAAEQPPLPPRRGRRRG